MRTAIVLASALAACTPYQPPSEQARAPEPTPPAPVSTPKPTPPSTPPPSRAWLSHWAGGDFDEVTGVAVNAAGETLAVGVGTGEVLLAIDGGPPQTMTAHRRSGLFVHHRPGGGIGHAVAFEEEYLTFGVAPTPDGGAMVVGAVQPPITEGADGVPVRSEPDGFIARFDAAGKRRWLHLVDGASRQEVRHVVAHPQGGAVIAGVHGGESRFRGDPQAPAFGTQSTFGGGWDVFIARIEDDARVRWVGELGGPDQESLADLAIGRDGTAVLTGECRGRTVARGGARTEKIECNALSIAVFLATWTADGALGWATRVPGPAKDTHTPEGVAITEDGEIVAVGMFSKGFGGGPLPTLRNRRPMFVDGFAVRYTAGGQPKWLRHFRGSQLERVWAVAPAGTGAWVLAEPSADLEIGDGKVYEPRPASGSNAMLLRFDAEGRVTHAEPFDASGDTRATRLEVAPDGDLRIAGSFQGTLRVPGGTATIHSVSQLDGFVLARPAPDGPGGP